MPSFNNSVIYGGFNYVYGNEKGLPSQHEKNVSKPAYSIICKLFHYKVMLIHCMDSTLLPHQAPHLREEMEWKDFEIEEIGPNSELKFSLMSKFAIF